VRAEHARVSAESRRARAGPQLDIGAAARWRRRERAQAAMVRRARSRPLRRSLLGCLLIVLCTTAAVSVAVTVGVVGTIADDFALAGKPLDSSYLTPAQAGAPETFLVIGDDHIGPTTTYSTGAEQDVNGYHLLHADTFMLVRMDPNQEQTSILSIPRDLYVTFTCDGQTDTGKFNSTYSVGGPDCVKKVVLQLLPDLQINHVIDFNFASFLGLVDAIGCVYIDVDHRYYNQVGDDYQPIDLQTGYQRLCGENALDYVRYRHDDSDFVRVARQQDFIRQAKEQLGVWGFVNKWNSLAKAFGEAVYTDIRGQREVAELLDIAVFSQSRPVRDVPFKVSNTNFNYETTDGVDEEAVASTPQLIKQSLDDFLYIRPAAPTIEHSSSSAADHHHHHHAASTSASKLAAHDLYPLTPGVSEQAFAMSVNVPFAVLAPTIQTGPAQLADVHAYKIGDEQHHLHYGYRIDWWLQSAGEYYGVEGMNWLNPPLFANPTATETIGGRNYLFVNDGADVQYLGWRQDGVLYWVSNTLNDSLSATQMLDIAQSTAPVNG
jgi:polyisoprenyl-teichoic acid--peptidoglycan teichoic acid transferase